MAKCPKCQKPVAENVASCPACGQLMPAKSTGTLDVGQHYQPDSDAGESKPSEVAKAPSDRSNKSKPAADRAKGTLGLPDIQDSSASPPSADAPAAKPIDLDATIDSILLSSDRDGTVNISNSQADAPAPGTVQYDDQDLGEAKSGSIRSGTAGRLKRLWQGAAGSSANPMHTLKGEDALATDSVFAKVARRVLVTDTAIEIAESVGTASASQPDRKARVEECIAIACRGAENETADYDLTGFLGQGGMGVVLKARQRAIGRDVAIKMIQPSSGQTKSSTNAQKKKFFYEAQITGKLDHPNIVPIYELGVCNDILFYSMKMIIGKEWKDVMRDNSRDENLDVLMKVADAMAFAHQRRIIHRDLKPENVMLGPFGEVLVTDWGCAIDLSRNESFTGAGSPPWMAPEMADHNLQLIGPRSDIYLLGAILYQIIAGYPPHPGQTVFECIEAAQKNIILPLEAEDPLLDIAYRAMEKAPDDRYQTVEAMQDAIRQYRRHAESITLTERSEALLVQAVATKDYERFSRTIFGFQDAIELWPENTPAKKSLGKARLAYGQCAFDKADYDLCLSTLDAKVPVEAELYNKAAKAKKIAEEREGRFKTLRKAFAAVVLLGLGVSSVLAGIASVQWGKAVAARKVADEKREEANTQREIADGKTREALENLLEAQRQKGIADDKTTEALVNLEEANRQKGIADDKTQEALVNLTEANRQRTIAEEKTTEALTNFEEAKRQTEIAEKRTAEVELVNYQSKVSLFDRQVKQSDVRNANAALQELLNADSYAALAKQGKLPKFDNWALNRVRLLSNAELRSAQPLGNVSAVAFADSANRGVVATVVPGVDGQPATGNLNIVELKQKKLQVVLNIPTATPVASVSISPDGDELVYSLVTGVNDSSIFRQSLKDNLPPVRVAQSNGGDSEVSLSPAATMQAFVMTKDRVVGGINGGLWVWSRSGGDWQNSPPQQISSVRGRMQSMQMLDENRAIILAELNNQLFIHLVDINAGSAQRIELAPAKDSNFARENLSASAVANGKLIVGTELGKLYSVDLPTGSTQVGPEFREILPQKHQSKIASIRVHNDGTLLTTAAEPVVHVWSTSPSQLSGWQYNTELAGTPENVGGVAFMNSSRLILGVGEQGNAIVWDVSRQKQRQQLQRLMATGSEMEYDAPVIQVVTSNDNQRAISIRSNGKIDTWNLVTGETINQSMAPDFPASDANFIGHSPGATFVDMAIDAKTNILITAAELPTEERAKDEEASADLSSSSAKSKRDRMWEFCKWNTETGKMVDRWTHPSPINQTVSLGEGGKVILYSSTVETIVKEAKREGATRFFTKDLGSAFAVAHPIQSNLMMTVKGSGSTRMFNTQLDDGGWSLPGYRLDYDLPQNSGLLSDDDVPLTGEWNPNGDRFYLIWASGRITEFSWENLQLSMKRDLRTSQLNDLGIALKSDTLVSTKKPGNVRLTSRQQLDLKVRSLGDNNFVYMAIRFAGIEGRTRFVRLKMPSGDETPSAEKSEKRYADKLLLSDDAEPTLQNEPFAMLPTTVRQDTVASRRVGTDSYFASSDGTVVRVSETGLTTYGKTTTISASGNAAANRIVTLHEGGILWLAEFSGEKWDWTSLTAAPATAKRVTMSPNGSELLVFCSDEAGQGSLVRMEAVSGKVVETMAQVQCGHWYDDGVLAMVTNDGRVLVKSGAEEKLVGQVEPGMVAQSIHHFVEPWSDPNIPAANWLVVHSETNDASGAGEIEYFSLDAQPAGQPVARHRTSLAKGITVLACSPTDNIFVTGGGGTVSVHFASPTLEQYGQSPLFSLEGHAGAEIESLTFSADGKTLVSSDSKNRLFGWLSSDALEGIASGLPESISATLQ